MFDREFWWVFGVSTTLFLLILTAPRSNQVPVDVGQWQSKFEERCPKIKGYDLGATVVELKTRNISCSYQRERK